MATLNKSSMHIGIDFDHTIVDYHNLFSERALSLGYIDASEKLTKDVVKNKIKELQDGENKWGILQSEIYSEGIHDASVMIGFSEFVLACQKSGINLSIISHKTKFNPNDPFQRDLKQAAQNWMQTNQFFDSRGFDFNLNQVFFADSIEEKISTIANQQCTHFIDDLPSILLNPAFPKNTCKILYWPYSFKKCHEAMNYLGNWWEISKYLFQEETHEA